MSRLPQQSSERIDRSQPLTFTFDGEVIQAYAGDTIASALLSVGRRTLSRSFKYHRPRGELCACGQCANSLVHVDGRPGVRACSEPVVAGMQVAHQNAWPSLGFDVMRATDLVGGPFTPVGFYYKTFIRPRRLWPLYEKVLRGAAGLGRLPRQQDDRTWSTRYQRRHCDVLVVGAGLAGLAAAIRAADAGMDVIVCNEDIEAGGLALAEGRRDRVDHLKERAQHAGVEFLDRGIALGFFDGLVPIWQEDTLLQVRAAEHILATGAIQQPLVFQNNDLPGVMLSGGARRLAALYSVKPGERAVVATVDDRGIADALDLKRFGVEVLAVADLRDAPSPDLAAALRVNNIELIERSTVVRVGGRGEVRSANLAAVNSAGRRIAGTERKFDCDLVAVSGGSQPALSLLLQAGGRADYDQRCSAFEVAATPPHVHVAGAVAGEGADDLVELSGRAAALQALISLGGTSTAHDEELNELDRLRQQRGPAPVTATPPAYATDGGRGKCFIDLDEDVTVKDVTQAVAEGYDSIELAKRYTTVTMGPSQGRFSQLPAVRLVAQATGTALEDVGLTTARPPWVPVPLGVLAGRPFEPAKRSALHERHRALRGNVRWAGDWRRPYHYGDPKAEALAVHESGGLIDVSTLGKLLVQGPEAGELLDRMYPNRMSDLKPGRIRYGVMISEAGRISDDGTVCRLNENAFYVTTTSAGASAVEQQMTWWLTTWGLAARITDLTQGVAAMNLAGPDARAVLSEITDLDCSGESFKYLDARHARVAGVEAMILRIGFVGELGYEIHCPAPQARHVWDAILDSGAGRRSIVPFGLEPQRILRLQKLHVIVGQDTDSEATPFNSALDWTVRFDKPQDFIGRWALERRTDEQPATQLVGFTIPSGAVVAEGAVVLQNGESSACQVTSSRWSPQLGASIGIATVPAELASDGAKIEISDAGQTHVALVRTRPFYDPEGETVRS